MLRKDVKEIKKKVDALSKDILNKMLELENLKQQIECIGFRVGKTYATWDDKRLAYVVKIEYNMPTVTLILDENGEAMINDRFRAINMLGLIPIEDQDRIINQLGVAKRKNSNGGDEK